ncbi:MAG: hypothetical protein Q8M83_02390 [bacterium]|nr:hypothetical protein [bacterium]
MDAERIFQKLLQNQIGQLVMGQLKLVQPAIFPTTYDQSLGLRKLIEMAVGPDNINNINPDITQKRFPLKGTDVRSVKLRVEPFLNGETSEQIVKRLAGTVPGFGNTGDLAGFLHDHPEEVEKWGWVVALSEDSRWTNPDGLVCVPYASVHGVRRYFYLVYFRYRFHSGFGVLVLCE